MTSEGFGSWIDRLCAADGVELYTVIKAIKQAFGPADVPILPNLIEALGHPNANVRWGATAALGAVGPGAVSVVPDMLRALRDADAQVRHDVATALGRIDPNRPEVIEGLLGVLLDDDDDVQAAAEEALQRILPNYGGPEAEKFRYQFRARSNEHRGRYEDWQS